jgi:hypothetical protein
MEKLDIHGTAGLVRYAIRRGLTEPQGSWSPAAGFSPAPFQGFSPSDSRIHRIEPPDVVVYCVRGIKIWGKMFVCGPREALRSFYCSGVDALLMGNFLVIKP